MKNIFTLKPKIDRISKLLAVAIIVSVLMPSALLTSPRSVSAQEASSESSSESSSSESSSNESDSGSTGSTESSESNNNATDVSNNVSKPNEAATNVEAEATAVEEESGGGGSASERQMLNAPAGATGSITFCFIIADINGNIKTNRDGLHPGGFFIDLSNSLTGENYGTTTVDRTTFAPNQSIITTDTNDAHCETYENLPFGPGFYYSRQGIGGAAINAWQTPKYNDQYSTVVNDLGDFFDYSGELFDNDPSNDEQRNLEADGYFVPLTPERPTRTLVILNRYTPGNQRPIIQMIGDSPMTVVIGTGYHEAGAVATDDWDDVTQGIVRTGTVDDRTVGRYEIHYNVRDRGTNGDLSTALSAETRIRVVNVVAAGSDINQAPVITLLGDNPMTITVGGTFTEPGYTAVDPDGNPDGSPRDLTHVVRRPRETVNTNVIGSYDLTYTVADGHSPTPASDQKVRRVNVVAENDNGNGGGGGGGGGGSSGGRSRRNNNNNNDGRVLGAETGPLENCVYLTDYMHRDWQNNTFEVIKLQSFLKYFEGFTDLQPTGVFDQATFDAVIAYQERYKGEILSPWGHDTATGFVYILTKKKINETFCQQAFPITPAQAEEIENFRAFSASLQASGVSTPDSNMTGTNVLEPVENLKDMDIKDIVGAAYPTSSSSPVVSVDGNPFENTRISPENIKAVAAAIFSVPNDRGMFLQSLYFLLIALIAIYLLTEIIVGSMDTSKLSKYQIWSRKATGYIFGLIIAIVVAVWYKIFSIVLPLLILVIIAGAFLSWAITKRSGDQVISLPPQQK